jgi:hypothetical protein
MKRFQPVNRFPVFLTWRCRRLIVARRTDAMRMHREPRARRLANDLFRDAVQQHMQEGPATVGADDDHVDTVLFGVVDDLDERINSPAAWRGWPAFSASIRRATTASVRLALPLLFDEVVVWKG